MFLIIKYNIKYYRQSIEKNTKYCISGWTEEIIHALQVEVSNTLKVRVTVTMTQQFFFSLVSNVKHITFRRYMKYMILLVSSLSKNKYLRLNIVRQFYYLAICLKTFYSRIF